jgi:CBS domain-containing protein
VPTAAEHRNRHRIRFATRRRLIEATDPGLALLPLPVPGSQSSVPDALADQPGSTKTTHVQRSVMPQWRVRDVMTTEVITAPDDASSAEIAAILADQRISAVPIVDRFDGVVGVVSWTDLRDRIDIGEPGSATRDSWWRRWAAPLLLRWSAGNAVPVMSAPPVTIGPDLSLPAAARVMYRTDVGRLLVVDDAGQLQGVVSRSDLLKVHGRMDAVIRDEVVHEVLRRTLMIEPGAVQATVDEGVVTLTGRTARKTTALAAARLIEAVAGVTGVVDGLAFDVDDTIVAPAASEPADGDPFRGSWIRRRPVRSVHRTAGSRRSNQPAQRATMSAALQ